MVGLFDGADDESGDAFPLEGQGFEVSSFLAGIIFFLSRAHYIGAL